MKLSMLALAAASVLAMMQVTYAQPIADTVATPASSNLRIINDTNVNAITVSLGTVIKFCLVDVVTHKKTWQVLGWDGLAVGFSGSGHYDQYLNECPSGTTFGAEFPAKKEGHSTMLLQHWDHDVPLGTIVPVIDWAVEVEVTR